MTEFVTRFAPSPTGHLHLGHAFSALLAYDAARSAKGRFVLRIEDIDRERCKPAFEDAIFEDLDWLGIEWETPVRRQSDHFQDYAQALQTLVDLGLAYRCFKTRKEVAAEIARAPHLAPDGPEGPAYIGAPLSPSEEAVKLRAGAPFAWRLSMTAAQEHLGAAFTSLSFQEAGWDGKPARTVAATPQIFGDIIIARKDSGTSYHLASVFDDGLQGIMHIIRGDDLKAAAHLHTLLQKLLGAPSPIYHHHRLILGEDGKRLAKRNQAATLKSLRERGVTPQDIRNRLGL